MNSILRWLYAACKETDTQMELCWVSCCLLLNIFFYAQFLCADGTNTQHEQLSGEGKKYHKNSQLTKFTKSIKFEIPSSILPRFQFTRCIKMQHIRQNDLKLVWGHLRNVNLLHLMGFFMINLDFVDFHWDIELFICAFALTRSSRDSPVRICTTFSSVLIWFYEIGYFSD